jgi:hypothetical protein
MTTVHRRTRPIHRQRILRTGWDWVARGLHLALFGILAFFGFTRVRLSSHFTSVLDVHHRPVASLDSADTSLVSSSGWTTVGFCHGVLLFLFSTPYSFGIFPGRSASSYDSLLFSTSFSIPFSSAPVAESRLIMV